MMNSVVTGNSEPFRTSQQLTYNYSRVEKVSINSVNSASDDTVSITGGSAESATLTYTKSMTLEGQVGAKYDLLQTLVANLLKEQGVPLQIETGLGKIDISNINQEEAQALVADDGYFGVEQTSDRIVELAIGIGGGDASRLAEIKEGIEKGFQDAKDALGGWLPEISYQTLDKVMEKLDQWAMEA